MEWNIDLIRGENTNYLFNKTLQSIKIYIVLGFKSIWDYPYITIQKLFAMRLKYYRLENRIKLQLFLNTFKSG